MSDNSTLLKFNRHSVELLDHRTSLIIIHFVIILCYINV